MPPALERRLVLRLFLVDGSDSVNCRTVEMVEGEPVFVGRASKDPSKYMTSADCNFHIPNSVVSRNHAQFTYHHGGPERPHEYQLFVEDLGSSHGTFLNGRHLPPNVVTTVSYADKIRFGTRVIRTDAEFPPPIYNVEFTEVEEQATDHVPGRSYSMPIDLDIPGYPYESDAESVDSAESRDSDYDDESIPDVVGMSVGEMDLQEQEGQIVDDLPVDGPLTPPTITGIPTPFVAFQSTGEPSLPWNEADSVSPSQLSYSQPISPEQSRLDTSQSQPVVGPETPMSSKTKMISLQEILNQDSWPTPETPTTNRKRKFDAIVSDEEVSYGFSKIDQEEYSDHEEDNDKLDQGYWPDFEGLNPPSSNIAEGSLAEEVSKIAQELKEPQEVEHFNAHQDQPASVTEPPRKRQRLSSIAVGIGAFIAGSVSTVAALASLPDNFFS